MITLRPGRGWKHLSGPVWENCRGSRIHLLGLVRLKDGTHHFLNKWKEGNLGRKLVRLNGGNKKRGLMAWAINLEKLQGVE